MSSIQVTCSVREYPDNETEYQTLVVRNHWNFNDRVVLEIAGKQYVFIARHLHQAITNACNAHA